VAKIYQVLSALTTFCFGLTLFKKARIFFVHGE